MEEEEAFLTLPASARSKGRVFFAGYVCISPRQCCLGLFMFVIPSQIPSQCMTCVAFKAVREYIVGKTAPVPVKIYDYYEPGVPLMNI